MALDFFKFLKPKTGSGTISEVRDLVSDDSLSQALQDFQIRELSFWSCVNFIGTLISRCEVRTFRRHEETRGGEYWLWNVEPNVNQSASVFWRKAVAKLYEDNETLLVPTRKRDGNTAFVVADNWQEPEVWPDKMTEYKGVTVGNMQYRRTFFENEVIHLKLFHRNIRPVIAGITASYMRLVQAAMRAYDWQNGQHWKVHVNQMASGADGWLDTFQTMLENQIKPFIASGSAILPEFDGYDFVNLSSTGGDGKFQKDSRDIRAMIDDILSFTARAFGIDAVLLTGQVEATGDAMKRTLTRAVDPLCDQISQEITRTRYGRDQWAAGSYARMSSAAIEHFDMFGMAGSIEKLMGSGWSYNDIQRAIGNEPINEAWANQHFITKNFGTSDEMEGNGTAPREEEENSGV